MRFGKPFAQAKERATRTILIAGTLAGAILATPVASAQDAENAEERMCECRAPDGQVFGMRDDEDGTTSACLAVGVPSPLSGWVWSCAWHPVPLAES